MSILNTCLDVEHSDELEFKHIKKRKIITTNNELKSDEDMTYEFLEFDTKLEDILPTLVPYGFSIKSIDNFDTPILFFLIDDFEIKSKNVSIIEENLFACSYYKGGVENAHNFIIRMIEKLNNSGYSIAGDIMLLPLIDSSVTSLEEEYLSEIQIPVKKS